MYCAYCGSLKPEGASYCHRCGSLPDVRSAPDSGPEPGHTLGSVPWRGGQVAWGILVIIIAMILIAFVAIGIGGLVDRYEDALVTWVTVHLMALAIIGVVWRFGVYQSPSPLVLLGLTRLGLPGPKERSGLAGLVHNGVLMAIVVLGVNLLFTALYGMIVEVLHWDALSPPEIESGIAFPGAAAILTFQALALVTPLTEELFFRGFVLRGLMSGLGAGWAIVSSAAIFSIFHWDIGVLVPVFVTGLLLGWLYHRTGSLWPGVLVHGAQNALALTVEVYLV